MDRLFCASLKRVWKNKCFWLCMGAMSAYIIWYMRSRCQIVSEDLTNEEKKPGRLLFSVFACNRAVKCSIYHNIFKPGVQ